MVFWGRFIQRQRIFRKIKKRIEEVITSSNCSFYVGKRLMALSVELVVTPTAEIANNLLKNVDEFLGEYFAKTNMLQQIGWSSNYTRDRGFKSVYLIELAWFNVSPNRRIYKKPGERYDFVPLPLCFFINCRSMLERLS